MIGCDFEKKSFSVPLQASDKDKNAMDWDKVFQKPNALRGVTLAKRQLNRR